MSSANGDVFDKDLNPVINACNNEELQFLVDLLSDTFTNFLTIEDDYKKYYPDHQKYAGLIAAHIRRFGGNSFANFWRALKNDSSNVTSVGPQYREIVGDVAEKLKVQFNKNNPTDELELLILKKITEKYLSEATEEQKKAILKEMSAGTGKNVKDITTAAALVMNGGITASAALTNLISAGSIGGFHLMTLASHYALRAMVGRGLPMAMTLSCSSVLPLYAGPIGWAVSGIWSLFGIASQAYRVTVPAVIYVAMLRNRQRWKQQGEEL